MIKVAELFAGVGGFRLGLERASHAFQTVFSNQWEPPGRAQFASDCYSEHYGHSGVHENRDLAKVLDDYERGLIDLGPLDLIVGGFPCQDYSVAKPRNHSRGLRGKKGVLWWQIHRLLLLQKRKHGLPRWIFLENVDRLTKSPATQRGRDFAVMLWCLSELGYGVEWRVVNAADFGFPQKRRRVFILATLEAPRSSPEEQLLRSGVLARAFPMRRRPTDKERWATYVPLASSVAEISKEFGLGLEESPFKNAGYMYGREAWTMRLEPPTTKSAKTLKSVLVPLRNVPNRFLVPKDAVPRWRWVKGRKRVNKISRKSGVPYVYAEGALPFPDTLNEPARTVLTSEGGPTPSRSKHVVRQNSKLRRLTPLELERLNGFPDDWTDTGMSDAQRAFCMGNALVVGLVTKVGRIIARESQRTRRR